MKTPCALITVFRPDVQKLTANIKTMLEYAGAVYLLFNSPPVPALLFDPRIKSVDNGKNLGLPRAINKGIALAAGAGFDYAILFDQDSALTKENFTLMCNELEQAEATAKVACIGPSLHLRNHPAPIPAWARQKNQIGIPGVISVKNIITSGMLVNIAAFLGAGGFDERFPVDFCDFYFCWKSIYRGYCVLQSADAYISHEIGTNCLRIKGHAIHFHAPYRNYFMVRDTLNLALRTKEMPAALRFRYLFFLPFRMALFLALLDKKAERLRMYWLGCVDFLRGNYGFGSIARLLDADQDLDTSVYLYHAP